MANTVITQDGNISVISNTTTNVVSVVTQGPQGPAGSIGNIDTSSFATTGSNNFVGNQVITGSLTVSGSNTFINIGPAIFSGSLTIEENYGLTGSLYGTASFATTSSYTLTASYAFNAAGIDTSSLVTTFSFNSFTSSYQIDSSSFDSRIFSLTSATSSYVQNSQTSSFVQNDQTSSFVQNSQTSSFVQNSQTSSFAQASIFNTFTGSYNTGSFTGSFIGSLQGTASWADYATTALNASNITLIEGSGISISGLTISSDILTVNGISPDINGNIATTLTAVLTGPSSSIYTGSATASLLNGTVWIVSNDIAVNNGDSYIFKSGSVGTWYPIAPLDEAAADARYIRLNATSAQSITSSLNISGSSVAITGSLNASSITGSLFGTSSWAKNATSSSYSTTLGASLITSDDTVVLLASDGITIGSGAVNNVAQAYNAYNASNAYAVTTYSTSSVSPEPYYLGIYSSNGSLAQFLEPVSVPTYYTSSKILAVTSSWAQTSSYAANAISSITASYITSSNVEGPHGNNSILSSSYSISSSYTITSSYTLNSVSIINNNNNYVLTATGTNQINSGNKLYLYGGQLSLGDTSNPAQVSFIDANSNNSIAIIDVGFQRVLFGYGPSASAPFYDLPSPGNSTISVDFGKRKLYDDANKLVMDWMGHANGLNTSYTIYDQNEQPVISWGRSSDYPTFYGTASLANNALTASFVTASKVQGPYGSNSILSSSYALTASYAINGGGGGPTDTTSIEAQLWFLS